MHPNRILLCTTFLFLWVQTHGQQMAAHGLDTIKDQLRARYMTLRLGDTAEAARIILASDSLFEAAKKGKDIKSMIFSRWLRIADLKARGSGSVEYMNHYLQVAEVARLLGDTVSWGIETGKAGANSGALAIDSCIKYLKSGIDILRTSHDTSQVLVDKVKHFYSLLLDKCAEKKDLYLLYMTAHAFLSEPHVAASSYDRMQAYGHLLRVFQAADRPDSVDHYVQRIRDTYLEPDPERNRMMRVMMFGAVADAYLLRGGRMDDIMELAGRDIGASETPADFPEAVRRTATVEIKQRAYASLVIHETLGSLFLAQNKFDSAAYHTGLALQLQDLVGPWNYPRHIGLEVAQGEALYNLGRFPETRVWLMRADSVCREWGCTSADNATLQLYLWRLDSMDGRWPSAAMHLYQANAWADSARTAEHKTVFNGHLFDLRLKDEQQKAEVRQLSTQADADRQRALRNIGFTFAGTVLLLLTGLWRQRNRISRARKRSDELLLNILPEEVAEELKINGTAVARHFEQATILFTDFKGFTEASEKLTPQELVEELNTCFKAFDHIITARGIEKIKTIGDAYMCAGGLPDPKTSSPADVVHAALEMQAFMTGRKTERDALGLPAFEMRVGIHTGPVVAGIVGVKKFQYDIWGDTVNTASRMESSGEVGQVNISESTYALVRDEVVSSQLSVVGAGDGSRTTDNQQLATSPAFTFTPRGKVQAKGKGEMEMYFVQQA